MAHYNRRQRRELARSMGMLKNESHEAWQERVRRSQEAGRQIDRQFKNNSETNVRNAQADADAQRLKDLIESVGEEKAKEMMANNRKVSEAREAKLAARYARQKAKLEAKK